MLGRGRGRAEPRDELVAIGVDGERREGDDLGANGDVAAEHLDLARPLGEHPTACLDGLEADEDDRVARVGKPPGEVMQHAAAGRHARSGDHDRRKVVAVDRLRGLDVACLPNVSRPEDVSDAVRAHLASDVGSALGEGTAVDTQRGEAIGLST